MKMVLKVLRDLRDHKVTKEAMEIEALLVLKEDQGQVERQDHRVQMVQQELRVYKDHKDHKVHREFKEHKVLRVIRDQTV